MNFARLAMATANEDVDAATEGAELDQCPVFEVTLRLFEKATQNNPTQLNLRKVAGETFDCVNVWTETIDAGDRILVGQLIDERWIAIRGDC